MEQIFVEIVNRSITAGWVILAVAALRLMVRRAPKWTVCLLWALVAVRLVCPFSLESAFSLIPSRETVHGGAGGLEGNFVDSGIRFLDDAVNTALRNSFDSAALSGAGLNGDAGGGRDTGADAGMYPDANPVERILSAAGILWIAGMGILLAHSLVSYIRLRRRVRTAVRLEESVYVSEFADTPFILGLVRPRIYLPSGMPEEMRSPVLAHEQAHLRRRDNLWKLCGYALLCVYWFHPLIWVAYTLFCRDMELACDESVIKEYDAHGRRMYSEALLACSIDRHAAISYPLAFGEVGVRERIRSVIQYKKPAFWAIVAAMAACIAVAICFLTDPVGSGEDSGDGLSLAAGADEAAGAGAGEGGEAAGGLDGEGGAASSDSEMSGGDEGMPDGDTMVQPYEEEGTGISKEHTVDIMDRLGKVDWDEIRRRNLPVNTEPGGWTDIICIGEIPEAGIRLYGYNDPEWSGEGVAIDIEGDVSCFDWIYTSPRAILPECYWNSETRQLQVALRIYTGTGADAEELHVLQYDKDNVLRDYALELDELQEKLHERIEYYIGEDKKSLWLYDKRNRGQLGKMDISESENGAKGLVLELGMISSYSLGEDIKLLVEPGYCVEGSAIAEYPDDTPQLEVEVLLSERDGKIQLAYLGEFNREPESIEFIEYVE